MYHAWEFIIIIRRSDKDAMHTLYIHIHPCYSDPPIMFARGRIFDGL